MKKRYYFLIGFLLIFVSIASYLYYVFEVKEYDVADEEVTKLTASQFEIELPIFVIDEQTLVNSENSDSSTSSDKVSTTSNTSTIPTLEIIISSYLSSFEELEAQANERLDQLVKHAYNEYKEKKAKKESISFPYFYGKYKTAGKALETQSDEAFYSLYTTLQNDLEKHGYDKATVTYFKTEYEQTKKDRQTALFSKVKNYF
ncbi:hypothetical protein DS745_09320 [Anaerobacillus alkaliphilus]|uniref:Uncharacterized protein n=1 Tax=Anaerobacillus alkaliphilus TaxID=1548597 RepID=A0A4Q0VTS3_9BACI|nr:hypothetical protein [Anaerobacillus alkaliphilus]RXJ01669.1 hypothetical protein DS745_09320 [Anaerobacillus alkaliphilus]